MIATHTARHSSSHSDFTMVLAARARRLPAMNLHDKHAVLSAPPHSIPCSPSTIATFDNAWEGCYDWCANNAEENCARCKCKSCNICHAVLPSSPPKAPPPSSILLQAPPQSIACSPETAFDDAWEGCYDWCANHVEQNCARCKCKACTRCQKVLPLSPPLFSPSMPPMPPLLDVMPSPMHATITTRGPSLPPVSPLSVTPTMPPTLDLDQGRIDTWVIFGVVIVGCLAGCTLFLRSSLRLVSRYRRARVQPAEEMTMVSRSRGRVDMGKLKLATVLGVVKLTGLCQPNEHFKPIMQTLPMDSCLPNTEAEGSRLKAEAHRCEEPGPKSPPALKMYF